ncbi:hypothetical protein FlaCF_3192 [Flavobacterium tructae]
MLLSLHKLPDLEAYGELFFIHQVYSYKIILYTIDNIIYKIISFIYFS